MDEKQIEKPEQVKMVAGFLASAIDIEDEMNVDIYGEFLARENWPSLMDEDSFQNIKNLLTILIEDTKRHRQIFAELLNNLPGDAEKYGE